MRIAVPNEVQDNENRVGMTPEGARKLVAAGHEVLVETQAGAGAGFPDDAYLEAGAQIASDAAEAWGEGELVVKVKQPIEEECELFRRGGVFFGYTHTETRPWLTKAFLEREMTAISFERVRLEDGSLPLLAPMSRIAGHMSVLIGAQLLQTVHGGPGVLVGNMPGAGATGVVIIGGGVVGEAAARVALALDAAVTVFELREERRAELAELLPGATIKPPDEPLVAGAVGGAWLVV
ncbi:MAG: alanine dehydrogenase, partial [Armatimonadota bacterium]